MRAGALGAEVAAIIKGLQTGDATLVTAAADQMHGNAADVGGSNITVTGGTLQCQWRDGHRGSGNGAGGRIAGRCGGDGAGCLHMTPAPPVGAEPVTLATADVTIAVGGPWQFGHARSGASTTPYVGIAARGAASDVPDATGMPEADTSSEAFAGPADAAGTENRLEPACARKERSLENDTRMMAPMTALGTIIGTAATSAVGGIGAVAVRQMKSAGRMREAA